MKNRVGKCLGPEQARERERERAGERERERRERERENEREREREREGRVKPSTCAKTVGFEHGLG